MTNKISHSLQHLTELGNNPYTLQQLAYWLYEYDDLYKGIKDFSKEPCEICKHLEKQDLPYDCLQKPEYCKAKYNYFSDFYEEVDVYIKNQKYEDECKKAVENYQLIKNDDTLLKYWVIYYYNLKYSDELATFYYCHLYHSKMEDEKYLKIANFPDTNLELIIESKEFENTITFVNTFSYLCFEKKLFPEKMEKINKEMEKIFFQ